MVTAAEWKPLFTVPLPAPKYWQTRHQQTRVTMGGEAIL
jgi:hypothetical protein